MGCAGIDERALRGATDGVIGSKRHAQVTVTEVVATLIRSVKHSFSIILVSGNHDEMKERETCCLEMLVVNSRQQQ